MNDSPTGKRRNYLCIEVPDDTATIDFLGPHPVVVTVSVDKDGELWIRATGGTDDAPILLDEVTPVPYAPDLGECEFCGDPATHTEQFDRPVQVCDTCYAGDSAP